MVGQLQGLGDAPSVANANSAEDDRVGGRGLLVWPGHGNGEGAGARTSSPNHPARRGGQVGSVGGGGGAGPGRPALVASWARANGGGQHQAGSRGWCHGRRCRGRAGGLFTIVRMVVVLPIVAVGVGILLAGMYWGDGLVPQLKTDRLALEVGLCLVLTCLAPRPKEPNRLGPVACPEIESCLRPTFRPYIPLNILGHHTDGSQMQTGW